MSETAMTEPRAAAADAPAAEARRKWTLYLSVVGSLILVDQVTKYVAVRTMIPYSPEPVVGDFFRLTLIYNRGAAFGVSVGDASRVFFIALAIVAVLFLAWMYRSTPWADRARLLAITLVTGGAIGNLIDRVRSARGVVDFFDFGVPAYRWPVFNVADIGVTCGAILLAWSLWQEDRRHAREKAADG